MNEYCSVCPAAERCPYFGDDSYHWNDKAEDRCDRIIEDMINKSRKEYYHAWMEYIREDD